MRCGWRWFLHCHLRPTLTLCTKAYVPNLQAGGGGGLVFHDWQRVRGYRLYLAFDACLRIFNPDTRHFRALRCTRFCYTPTPRGPVWAFFWQGTAGYRRLAPSSRGTVGVRPRGLRCRGRQASATDRPGELPENGVARSSAIRGSLDA